MKLEKGNLVRITDDEVKIAKFKEEGYKEVEDVEEEATVEEMETVDKEAIETAKEKEKADKEVEEVSEEKADKEAKEVEVAEEKAEEKKTTGRGRANNKK